MIDELDAASKLLKSALENYLRVCSIIPSWPGASTRISRSRVGWASKELSLVTSYETIIQQAKAIISQARNYSTSLAPVNTLPDEILSRIFRLVLESQLRNFMGKDPTTLTITGPQYPESLSHVCTHWRHVAIDFPLLWTHIDIVTRHYLSRQLYARSEVFASRARNLPMTLHISDFNHSTSFTHPDLRALCTSVSTRIQDLLVRPHHSERNKCQLLVLRACLAYCTPGVLRSLSLRDDCRLYSNQFLDLPPRQHESETWWLDLPGEFLEKLLVPVQKLYLRDCFFNWDSGAYSGLTELHLRARSIIISPHILVRILKANPQLCVLHFGIPITGVPLAEDMVPARLPHLEILNLCWLNDELYPVFFRLLSPDTEPLQLSLQYTGPRLPAIGLDFFHRHNITQLYMDGPYGEDVCLSDIIIDVLPKLQSLVLAHFKLYGDELFQPDEDPDEIPDGVLPKIGLVRLVACSIGLKETRLMIRRYSVRRLVLWDCDFLLDDDWDESSYALDKDHPEKNETRREYFAGTGAVVDIVDAPPPECHISNDWEEWHPWKPWP